MKAKLQSRKFWAWIVWTVLAILGLFKLVDSSVIFQWYGPITLIYIGAEAGIDMIKKKV